MESGGDKERGGVGENRKRKRERGGG